MTSGPFSCWYFLLLKLRIFWCYLSLQIMAILCCVAKNSLRGTVRILTLLLYHKIFTEPVFNWTILKGLQYKGQTLWYLKISVFLPKLPVIILKLGSVSPPFRIRIIHTYVFGSPGSGSIGQEIRIRILPSSSKSRKKKKLIPTVLVTYFILFIFGKWCKCTLKKLISNKKTFLLTSWRSLTKISGSGFISQWYGSTDPDP